MCSTLKLLIIIKQFQRFFNLFIFVTISNEFLLLFYPKYFTTGNFFSTNIVMSMIIASLYLCTKLNTNCKKIVWKMFLKSVRGTITFTSEKVVQQQTLQKSEQSIKQHTHKTKYRKHIKSTLTTHKNNLVKSLKKL